jgi:hypothetical protein
MNKTFINDALQWLRDVAVILAPGALGAAVSIATQTGLSWAQRFLHLAIGIIVSYYVGEAARDVFGLSDMVKSSIGFVAGLAAFESVKNLRGSIAEIAKTAPHDIWNNVKSWFGRKS